ncbi:MAG: hypothetical protein CVV27_06630 [Candidatus Melainabacteria bacterium HGW-Melainabacteria-1]|nr:MAG: hypothetical protein CVV27_06630 [Candidatus Melainabacteria bacterium HGW-Melainabacteria-1]
MNQPLKQLLAAELIPRIKAFLRERLPDYMLPRQYLWLDQLPLNASGKVLRSALPLPAAARRITESTYQPPRTPLEQQLCGLYTELLGIERVGVLDSFFDLGGHSLLAIQLLARIQPLVKQTVPLKTLFEAPTVAELAARLGTEPASALPFGLGKMSGMPPLKLRPAPPGQLQKLSYSQALWWTIFPTPAELAHGIQNSYAGIRLQGHPDPDALEAAIQAIIQRHEALRTRFASLNRRPRRVIDQAIAFALPRYDFAGQSEDAAIAALEAAAQAPFDLEAGPLIRAALYRLRPDLHLLMLSVSHLVFDGWSLKQFLAELQPLYLAQTQPGYVAQLPELPIQYSDYVYWHRKWIKQSVIRHQLLYWLRLGKDMPVVLDLPTDKPRPTHLTLAGSSVSFSLPAGLVRDLQSLAQRQDATLYMLMLAAFQVLLSRYSGQADIFVGTPVANRPVRELDAVMGLFVNFIVLRGNLAGQPRFVDFLEQLRQTCLDAYAHQDLPFQILFKSFRAYKTLTSWQRFATQKTMRSNVMFNLIDDVGADFQLGELQASLLPLENRFASQAMHLILLKQNQGIQGQLNFSADLFHRETIESLCQQYLSLLNQILAHPEQTVGPKPG